MADTTISLSDREAAVLKELRAIFADNQIDPVAAVLLLGGNDAEAFTALLCKLTMVYQGVMNQIAGQWFSSRGTKD